MACKNRSKGYNTGKPSRNAVRRNIRRRKRKGKLVS